MKYTLPVLIALSLFFLGTLSAQYTYGKPNGSWGVVVGSEMGFRIFTSEDSELFRGTRPKEGKRNSYRLGINRSFHLSDDFYFKSGLRIVNTGFNAWVTEGLENRENDSPPKFISTVTANRRRYLEIEVPIAVRHLFMSKTCGMYVEAGLSPQVLMAEYKVTQDQYEKISDPSRSHFSLLATLSIGTEWHLRKLPVFIEYAVRYQLTPTAVLGVKERELGIGFELGTRKYF